MKTNPSWICAKATMQNPQVSTCPVLFFSQVSPILFALLHRGWPLLFMSWFWTLLCIFQSAYIRVLKGTWYCCISKKRESNTHLYLTIFPLYKRGRFGSLLLTEVLWLFLSGFIEPFSSLPGSRAARCGRGGKGPPSHLREHAERPVDLTCYPSWCSHRYSSDARWFP